MYYMAGCTKGQSRVFLEEDQRVFALQDAKSAKSWNSLVKESGYFLVEPVRTVKDRSGYTILIVKSVKKLDDSQVTTLRGLNSQILHGKWRYAWLMNFLACLALYPVYVPVVPYEAYTRDVYKAVLKGIKEELGKSDEEKREDQQARELLPKMKAGQDLDEDVEYIWKHCGCLGWSGMNTGFAAKSNEEAQKVWLQCYEAVKAGKPVSRSVYRWAREVLKDLYGYAKYFSIEKAPEIWQDFVQDVSQIGTLEKVYTLECAEKFAKCKPGVYPYMVMHWPKSGHAIRAREVGAMEIECMYCAGGDFHQSLDWCLKNANLCANARIYTRTVNYDKIAYADLKFRVNLDLLTHATADELDSKAKAKAKRRKSKKKKVAEKIQKDREAQERAAEEQPVEKQKVKETN